MINRDSCIQHLTSRSKRRFKMKHNKIILKILVILACLNYCKSDKCEASVKCQFPFNIYNKVYNSCTKVGNYGTNWCAVSVDKTNLEVKRWGNCSESCQDGSIGIKHGSCQAAPCKFPFKYLGRTYNACVKDTGRQAADEDFWCPTEVDENSEWKEGTSWGFCSEACLNKDVDGSHWLTALAVTISICFLIFSSIITVFCYYAKRNKEEEVIKVIEVNEDTILDGNIAMINSSMVLNEQSEHLSYSGKCEIERSKFEIGQKIGGGSYGSVHEGTTKNIIHHGQKNKVAIKSVKNPLDPAQIYTLVCEIKVLDKLENHLNLVNMIGACTTEFKTGKIWLLLEYCSHGDMKNFLLNNRDVISEGLHYQRVPHEVLNIRLFLKWSHSICKGMQYLASKNIMHGDLAARNILITNVNNDESYLAKICDFGLSKNFYDKDSYEKQDRKNIPWKWMDVDFFETGVLRMSSDVWSFGVVFWEMLSMGGLPYAGGDADDTIKKNQSWIQTPNP